MYNWKKGIASWVINHELYLSVPFTWLLPDAKLQASTYKGKKVHVGGPAVDLMPEYLSDVASVEKETFCSPLTFHNPLATFTSRGCPNKCGYCAVPKIEGTLQELKEWIPLPIICDNNFLACSKKHFEKAIERLKHLPFVDFNQGLDPSLLKSFHLKGFASLNAVKLRFAWDEMSTESHIAKAIERCQKSGFKDISCYVLIGFKDTPEQAQYRLETLRKWKVLPNPMRYQPLDALKKNQFVPKKWTAHELGRMSRYYSRLCWLGGIEYKDYLHSALAGEGFGL